MGKPRREHIRQVLARNVRIQRDSRGWTQEELAELASLSFRAVSVVETGKSACYLDTVGKLAAAFKVDEAVLLDRATVFVEPDAPKPGRPRAKVSANAG